MSGNIITIVKKKIIFKIYSILWNYSGSRKFKLYNTLKVIHESNLIHGDFHDGNILMSDNYNEIFIIDLGLCKPISDLQDSNNNVNGTYGVLPYMAPEILRKNPIL
ncbi:unnamed protein product [Rhizophagus irregularis]|nr:unnamed protein product [Rhizophagus irregularis]